MLVMVCLHDRLARHAPAWRRIGASDTVLRWITQGVPLPFKCTPQDIYRSNPVFSSSHRNFIATELKDLLRRGAIEVCTVRPKVVCALNVVPKKNKKLRLP